MPSQLHSNLRKKPVTGQKVVYSECTEMLTGMEVGIFVLLVTADLDESTEGQGSKGGQVKVTKSKRGKTKLGQTRIENRYQDREPLSSL